MRKGGWHIGMIGACVGALVIFDVLAARTAFPAETSAKSDHRMAPQGKGPAPADQMGKSGESAKSEPAGNAAHESNPATSGGRQTPGHDADKIDTRITVQPPPANSKRESVKAPSANLDSFGQANAHLRRWTAHPPPQPTMRNTIGVPVAPNDSVGRHETHVFAPIVHGPAVPAGAAAPGTIGGIARQPNLPGSTRSVRVTPPPSPSAPPASVLTAHGEAITGTHLARPGLGPAQIGGPAKTVAGISGTNIKHKH
jgi:hypothetical protein